MARSSMPPAPVQIGTRESGINSCKVYCEGRWLILDNQARFSISSSSEPMMESMVRPRLFGPVDLITRLFSRSLACAHAGDSPHHQLGTLGNSKSS